MVLSYWVPITSKSHHTFISRPLYTLVPCYMPALNINHMGTKPSRILFPRIVSGDGGYLGFADLTVIVAVSNQMNTASLCACNFGTRQHRHSLV